MEFYGITLTQKYTAMISAKRNEEFTAISQGGFYKRFCAAQDFAELFGEDFTINNIEAIDYSEWKMRIHEVQRSSTPLFGSRESELLILPFEKENAALLTLMGQALIGENASINMNKTIAAIDYTDWKMQADAALRSSTPLLDRRREMAFMLLDHQNAALHILMGQQIFESDY